VTRSEEKRGTDLIGAVAVVGGGICGMRAALDLAESGFKVYLIEESDALGGHLAQLDRMFPTNDCGMCQILPRFPGDEHEGFCLRTVFAHRNVEVRTCTEVQDVEGEAGRFTVSLHTRGDQEGGPESGARAPTRRGVGKDLESPSAEERIEVGAVILATGYEAFDASLKREYGYGVYQNVLTGLEFERMLSRSGPPEAQLLRPSDGEKPRRLAFIQCVGSRDISCGQGYCSSVCCMYTAKEAILAKEHLGTVEATVFCSEIRTFGKDFERYYEKARNEYGVRYIRCMASKIFELQQSRNLLITYLLEDGGGEEEEFDLAVLAVGLRPPERAKQLAERLGLDTNAYGFCRTGPFDPVASSRPGVFVCGALREPQDLLESVAEASAAASAAAQMLAPSRGVLLPLEEIPPEREADGEEPRIGVFLCRCGHEIGDVVDVSGLVERARGIRDVVWAEDVPYMCTQDGLACIGARLEEHALNRVIVAACSPRTHGRLFRNIVRKAGLNRHLFEMVNVRDQCAWVHRDESQRATRKAADLIEMAAARARLLRPIRTGSMEPIRTGLVVGGGPAGLVASLSLAEQGFQVHLIEREAELGGMLRHLQYTLDGSDPQALLQELVARVEEATLVHIHRSAEIEHLSGSVGDYRVRIACADQDEEREHLDLQCGAILVATGGREYRPEEYLYGQHERVITQRELEQRLGERDKGTKGQGDKGAGRQESGEDGTLPVPPSPHPPIGGAGPGGVVVMIQCVGSRNDKHPYCSRVCCSQAIKNALKLREMRPEARIFVLYRDLRTYGLREEYYRKAREAGVVFLRYEPERKPLIRPKGDRLRVEVLDPVLNAGLALDADLLVLGAGVVPAENRRLAEMLNVPLTSDGFFSEAHATFRPLDSSADGVFLCGLAHSPRDLSETIAQAQGAAARAATILSKDRIEAQGTVATVKEKWCVGCGVCVQVCPYDARYLDEERRVAVVEDIRCQGCGACAAACPSGASQQQGFEGRMIFSMIEAAAG